MSEVSQVHLTVGRTGLGMTVDVTYRCVGQPHVFQYVSARQLLSTEVLDLVESAVLALLPGVEPPELEAQLPLPGIGLPS